VMAHGNEGNDSGHRELIIPNEKDLKHEVHEVHKGGKFVLTEALNLRDLPGMICHEMLAHFKIQKSRPGQVLCPSLAPCGLSRTRAGVW
jgi:hypothetical protein